MPPMESPTPALEMAHVLGVDLLLDPAMSADEKQRAEHDVEGVVRACSEFERGSRNNQTTLQSGDHGLALLFFGDPEAPVRCAVELSRALRARSPHLKVRMGIHSGPAYREASLRTNCGVMGGGVGIAQEVAEYGNAGHILVTGATAELLQPLSRGAAALHDLGGLEAREGDRLQIFNCYGDDFGNAEPPERLRKFSILPAAETSPDPMIGCQVSHYKVLKELGGGGMGIVYEAQDLRLGRRVALKFLPEDQWKSRSRMERFMQEARAASSLNHPNICIVHDVGDFEGRYFIVMELLEGETLRHLIKQKQLTREEIIQYGVQIADALDCAHSQGIIHRDIKPANIFVSPRGQVKVLDFGLAKFTSRNRSDMKSSNVATESGADLTSPGEFVGTVSYMSPEQARGQELDQRSDLFSFGVVLYEMATGAPPFFGDTSAVVFEALLNRAPVSPVRLNPSLPKELERIINKALEKDRNLRYRSAPEMRADLLGARSEKTEPARLEGGPISKSRMGEIAITYKRDAQPDEQILRVLEERLREEGYKVFVDRHPQADVEWALEIEKRVSSAHAVIVLLSASAASSEMLAYEVQVAHEAAQKTGHPRILPVRIDFESALPSSVAAILEGLPSARWQSENDNEALVAQISEALRSQIPEAPQNEQKTPSKAFKLESVGGAVPLDSKFYILRPTDEEFYEAIVRRDSIVLIKGARQMGKTSLMARGLQEARRSGARVILTDYQKLNAAHLESVEKLFLALGETITEQLDMDISLADTWNPRRGPSMNFERFLRREILAKLNCPLLWGMDEVDRLFSCNFGSEVFGLFRSWHNERSLDPTGPWQNLTLAIAYATEAHMFITDMNQSPFNVGTRLELSDFTLEQVAELNDRYDSPLRDQTELARFHELVAGQPYLTRRGLHEMANRKLNFWDFEAQAVRDDGPFGDHLRRLLVSLAQDSTLFEIMRALLGGRHIAAPEAFYRLRSAGLVAGESAQQMRPRCKLYELYLAQHLS